MTQMTPEEVADVTAMFEAARLEALGGRHLPEPVASVEVVPVEASAVVVAEPTIPAAPVDDQIVPWASMGLTAVAVALLTMVAMLVPYPLVAAGCAFAMLVLGSLLICAQVLSLRARSRNAQ